MAPTIKPAEYATRYTFGLNKNVLPKFYSLAVERKSHQKIVVRLGRVEVTDAFMCVAFLMGCMSVYCKKMKSTCIRFGMEELDSRPIWFHASSN